MNLPAKVCLGAGAFLAMSGGLLALTGFALGAQTHLNMPFGGGSAVAAETPMVHVEVAADEGTATESWVQVPAFSRIEVELDMGNVSVMPTGSTTSPSAASTPPCWTMRWTGTPCASPARP